MSECIFCKIVNKEISAKIVYEDDRIIAFEDISKVSAVHILVIPKQHLSSVLEVNETNKDIVGDIFLVINKLAKDYGVDITGFRVVTNCGSDAYQTVKHLHYHVLGGEPLGVKLVTEDK